MKTLIRWALRFLPRTFLIRVSYLLMRLFKPFLRGDNVKCPVCGATFRKFLPYGINSRANVLCPSCFSLERHRLIWLYLERETNFQIATRKVLHVAPEQCFHKRFSKMANLDYLTADLESPIADYHFDLHQIPFEQDQFDLVLCNHVMEHVEDDFRVMSEILRILKPNGLAILQVPLDPDLPATYEDKHIIGSREREKHFGQKDHVRLYGTDYPDRLRRSGFVVKEQAVKDLFTKDEIQKFRLDIREVLFLAFKPL